MLPRSCHLQRALVRGLKAHPGFQSPGLIATRLPTVPGGVWGPTRLQRTFTKQDQQSQLSSLERKIELAIGRKSLETIRIKELKQRLRHNPQDFEAILEILRIYNSSRHYNQESLEFFGEVGYSFNWETFDKQFPPNGTPNPAYTKLRETYSKIVDEMEIARFRSKAYHHSIYELSGFALLLAGGICLLYIDKIFGLFIHEVDEQGEEDDDALKSATASSAQSLFPNRKKDGKDGGGKPKIKFADVRGIDDFKEELEEIVAFLKAPELFEKIGAKLPMGVLMAGPPGVGKTMLAKAIAGEVSFYYAAGSQFEEKYVGVGAKRIRMLFEEAKKNAPSIIFIDEIDAVASRRNPEFYSGNSSTLNQLLAEMDGFTSKGKVVVIGATNMPELLDPAISRPGRFDKTIHISAPDYKGRYEILQSETHDL